MKTIACLLIILASFFSGCVGTQANMQEASLKRQGMPPEYAAAFKQGYQSGQRAGGNPWAQFVKDPEAYMAGGMYKQGWDDGFAQGKGQYDSITGH